MAYEIAHANVAQILDFGEERTNFIALRVRSTSNSVSTKLSFARCQEAAHAVPPRYRAAFLADAAADLHAAHELRGRTASCSASCAATSPAEHPRQPRPGRPNSSTSGSPRHAIGSGGSTRPRRHSKARSSTLAPEQAIGGFRRSPRGPLGHRRHVPALPPHGAATVRRGQQSRHGAPGTAGTPATATPDRAAERARDREEGADRDVGFRATRRRRRDAGRARSRDGRGARDEQPRRNDVARYCVQTPVRAHRTASRTPSTSPSLRRQRGGRKESLRSPRRRQREHDVLVGIPDADRVSRPPCRRHCSCPLDLVAPALAERGVAAHACALPRQEVERDDVVRGGSSGLPPVSRPMRPGGAGALGLIGGEPSLPRRHWGVRARSDPRRRPERSRGAGRPTRPRPRVDVAATPIAMSPDLSGAARGAAAPQTGSDRDRSPLAGRSVSRAVQTRSRGGRGTLLRHPRRRSHARAATARPAATGKSVAKHHRVDDGF